MKSCRGGLVGRGRRGLKRVRHPRRSRLAGPSSIGTRPAAVFNAAAYTDVIGEIEPEVAFAVNEAGARSVARASAAAGVAVVHYS